MSTPNKIVLQNGMVPTEVSVPTVITCMVDIGKKMSPSVCVQWFGEHNYSCTPKDSQFFFDTGISPHHCMWMEKLETFQIVFIGFIKNWIYPSDINRLLEIKGWTRDTAIMWLMSPYSLNEGVPSSPILRIALANNPKYKDIIPKSYFAQSVRDKVLSEVATKNPISKNIDHDEEYGFEVKKEEQPTNETDKPTENDVWED